MISFFLYFLISRCSFSKSIRFSSQWFDQAAFDGVWQAWQGKCWQPAQIEFLGDLRLDPGDLIRVADRAGTEYTLAVMGIKHSFDGGFRTTVSCYGPGESGYAQPQTVSQAITGLKTDLGRFRRLYTDNLEATAAQIKHITTEDIVGECGTINLAKGTFEFGDALVWDGSHLTVRGTLESGEGTVGGWGVRADRLETSYEGDDGFSMSWDGYTRLIPSNGTEPSHDAGLMLYAHRAATGSDEASGWFTFHRGENSQWVYDTLKMGSEILGGHSIIADRYRMLSEVSAGFIGSDTTDVDSYGVRIAADNQAGVRSALEVTPGRGVSVTGDLVVGGRSMCAPPIYYKAGKIWAAQDGADPITGIGLATIVITGRSARIDFSVRITTAGTNQMWDHGILSSLLSESGAPYITPVAAVFPCTITTADDGGINTTLTGYAGGMVGVPEKGEWTFGRIYTEEGTFGGWEASAIPAGVRIMGTVYGTVD